uniref:NADH-ubiquinone oxidoreductase chain 3 n=1 Tax=Acropyga guianensis TaxID=602208 RepID=A0A6G5NIC6_9HYME|nr:NADH dehydrogenase subunit 3 [Acropyga guianensis]QBG38619.1 NADH dehydrogenase subunit 3 [Acropyga guianensis]
MLTIYLIMICMFISFMILMINIIFSIKFLKMREKMSPFECGFDPLTNPRLPFSIQFFLISLIFLIFDIEITLLIPLIYIYNLNKIMIFSSFLFLIILMFGLIIEYFEQSIDWKN